MKRNKLQEERQKKLSELSKDLMEIKERLLRAKLEILTGKLKNTRSLKNLRREKAQIETLIAEKNDQGEKA